MWFFCPISSILFQFFMSQIPNLLLSFYKTHTFRDILELTLFQRLRSWKVSHDSKKVHKMSLCHWLFSHWPRSSAHLASDFHWWVTNSRAVVFCVDLFSPSRYRVGLAVQIPCLVSVWLPNQRYSWSLPFHCATTGLEGPNPCYCVSSLGLC